MIADMEIENLGSMGTDITVVNAARVSFDKRSGWEQKYFCTEEEAHVFLSEEPHYFFPDYYYSERYTSESVPVIGVSERDRKLIRYLAKHEHWSPFAHCMASFRVKAPLFVARQLAKHQVGFSWNEVSRRYVDSPPEFYIPSEWRMKADDKKQGSSEEGALDEIGGFRIYCQLAKAFYQHALDLGVCPEQARMILPQNTMTEWWWTGSLYGWSRMYKLRADSHTQKETREIAEKIGAYMRGLFPVSWEALTEVVE